MAYTKTEILEKCEKAFKNVSTFYQSDVVNYRGVTSDTGELYSELVAEFILDNLDKFISSIKQIRRETSYKTVSHTGDKIPDDKRLEEKIAVEMFNMSQKQGVVFEGVGRIIDYQTPLKNTAKDNAGKIDLLGYDGKTLRILELKTPDSTETMLRCVLEGFTYLQTIKDQDKFLKDFSLPENTEIIACPFVFSNGAQKREMEDDSPKLKELIKKLNCKPCYITDEYHIKSNEVELNKILDCVIMQDETSRNSELTSGYVINGRSYNNYLSNDCFDSFVKDMKNNYPIAFEKYNEGSGGELEIRKGKGGAMYPPKMASFGSSSRMIYNLLKDVDGIVFEKQLPTTVGGIAHLDGFVETDSKCIFIEAKCREPYSEKKNSYEWKYEALYNYITESVLSNVSCEIKGDKATDSKMIVTFKVNGKAVKYFDLKQMISHLLGVATMFLKGELSTEKIEFYYLIFNPMLINIDDKNAKDEIQKIYKCICKECENIDFKSLFAVIVSFLKSEKGLGIDVAETELINSFLFKLCDQNNIKECITK